MNAVHTDATRTQKPSLRQRASASRRSADHVMPIPSPVHGKAIPVTCAAERLGKLLEEAWMRLIELEEVMTPDNAAVLQPMAEYCKNRIDELELAVSYARAASPAGMLMQLAVAFDAADLATTGTCKNAREFASLRVERCLYSVAAALCSMTGTDRSSGCTHRYMSAAGDVLAFLSPEVV